VTGFGTAKRIDKQSSDNEKAIGQLQSWSERRSKLNRATIARKREKCNWRTSRECELLYANAIRRLQVELRKKDFINFQSRRQKQKLLASLFNWGEKWTSLLAKRYKKEKKSKFNKKNISALLSLSYTHLLVGTFTFDTNSLPDPEKRSQQERGTEREKREIPHGRKWASQV
jgi:hypothetical protein